MSDAAREEDYYQPMPAQSALASSEPSYKTGLPSPVAAANANEGMRFKGAMGGAAVGNEYPDHEPRLSVPYNRYKQLETADPTLYEAINHVAEEQRIPPTDLAALVYASSANNPSARDGPRVGYTGLTVNDSRQLDPEGQLDINKPVDNLFLGAEKYKRIADRYGMGTPAAFAAYHAGPDRVDGVLQQHPNDHASVAPAGMFEFVNRVAGRDGQSPEQQLEENAANVDISQRDRVLKPQGSNIPAQDAIYRGDGPDVEPIPNWGTAPQGRPRPLRVSSTVPADISAGLTGAEPVPGGDVGEMARQRAAQPPERFVPGSQPVPPTVPTPPPPGPELRAKPQYAPGTEPSDATREIIRERATNPAPPYFTPGRPAIGSQPNYNLDPNAPIPPPPAGPPPAVAGLEPLGPQYPQPPAGGTPEPPPGPDYTPPPRDVISAPTVMPPPGAPAIANVGITPDVAAALPQPGRIGRAPYPGMVGGDYGGGGEPTPPPTTSSAGRPARPRAALTQTPSTDTMAADLNRQELARIQAGRPDVVPTGPTQALAGAPLPPPDGAPQVTPTTTPPGGAPPGAGVGTSAPAGAPKFTGPVAGADAPKAAALAQPGSPVAPTREAPIDRLNTNTGTMTSAGAVRAAAAGGPNGLLTYMTRGGRRGSSTGDQWNYVRDMFTQAMILKGDPVAAMHANEYVFEMQHRGAMDNLMQAVGSFQSGDMNGAAQFLAKSHAFVTDGAVIGFQPTPNGQLWGQRYDEQAHDKIGAPFQITREGLTAQAMANSDRKNFFTNMHNAQTANETARHNRKSETHLDESLKETVKDREARMKEKQTEFDIVEQRRRDLADQADLRQREINEANRQSRELTAQGNRQAAADRAHERQLLQDQQRADAGAKLNEGRAKQVQEDTTRYFGEGDQPGTAADASGKPYSGDALRTARDHFYAIGLHNHRPAESVAQIVQGLMAGTYKSIPWSDGKIYFKDMTQKDEKGEPLDLGITVPRHALQRYIPMNLPPAVGAQPPPRATQK